MSSGERRKEEEGGRRKEEEKATNIKSNNPHLAGGEKHISFFNDVLFWARRTPGFLDILGTSSVCCYRQNLVYI